MPQPDPILEQWLYDGWDDYRYGGKLVKDSIVLADIDGSSFSEPIAFKEDAGRVEALEAWVPLRKQWANATTIAMAAKSLF